MSDGKLNPASGIFVFSELTSVVLRVSVVKEP